MKHLWHVGWVAALIFGVAVSVRQLSDDGDPIGKVVRSICAQAGAVGCQYEVGKKWDSYAVTIATDAGPYSFLVIFDEKGKFLGTIPLK